MRLITLQTFEFLILDGLPPNGIDLETSLKLLSNAEAKAALVNDVFHWSVGDLEAKRMLDSQSYAHGLVRIMEPDMDPNTAHGFARVFNMHIKTFLLTLWFVKDNAANAGTNYVRAENEGGPPFSASARYTSLYRTATCALEPVGFSRAELDLALTYYRKLFTDLPTEPLEPPEEHTSGVTDDSRIRRTLYFVQAARNGNDIALKLAFYAICLESLFSTDDAGIAHRVAERTATFIGQTGSERRTIYRDIKALYDARSKVVHGSPIAKKKMPELFGISQRADEHLRRCIRRVLDDVVVRPLFVKNDGQAIAHHFLDELFPIVTPSANSETEMT